MLSLLALSLVPVFASRRAQTSITTGARDLSSNIISSEKNNPATISNHNTGLVLPLQSYLCQTCESLPKHKRRKRKRKAMKKKRDVDQQNMMKNMVGKTEPK